MKPSCSVIAVAALIVSVAPLNLAAAAPIQNSALPVHTAPPEGNHMVVQLCDGETYVTLKGIRPDEHLTKEQAQQVSDRLMAAWLSKQPPEVAAAWQRENAAGLGAQQTSSLSKTTPSAIPDEQPLNFSARDQKIWEQEQEREIAYGEKIFHDDKLLGSTNGVSCAMCHPNAANTHPETYPKFQLQLERVALLRDMINWCLENPSRAPRLDDNDPRMRALEAYILSQRRGVPIQPGKH